MSDLSSKLEKSKNPLLTLTVVGVAVVGSKSVGLSRGRTGWYLIYTIKTECAVYGEKEANH